MAEQEQIWQVDENDNPIGPVGRDDSRRLGLKYRMVRASVEDADNNVLIQKRVETKKTYPGCWDTSAGGNIDYPETYEEAIRRELAEEIGINDVDLEEVAYFYSEAIDPDGNKMNRFTKVFRTVKSQSIQLKLQESEVSEARWVSRDELRKIVDEGNITDGLKQTFEHYYSVS